MLDSVKIARRQSEIRQSLAELAGAETLTEETRSKIDTLDREYQDGERRFRAALISEDSERREAGGELETRGDRERAELFGRFELRQAARLLDEGRPLEGATREVVEELRSAGSYRGVPIPLEALALETRAGETIAAGVPEPTRTVPILDRLWPASVAARMGAQMINVGSGVVEIPVATSGASAGWADGELAPVPGPHVFATTDRSLKPNHNLGAWLKVSRRALLQAGDALEAAIRRDLNGAIGAALDRAVFVGTGANGQPLGVITGAATYGIPVTAVDAPATWGAVRSAVAAFMVANMATGPADVRALLRPEVWDYLDGEEGLGGASEWARLGENLREVVLSANVLPAPAGDPLAATALLTTPAGGAAPIYIGSWGAIDLIRDPYTDAPSGALRLTGILTADVTVARPGQLRVLTGLELEAAV